VDAIADFFSRHSRVALQFSAGKDSAACLWLLEPWWPQLTVMWCNMGDPYPETIDYMDSIALRVPHFVVVRGDVRGFIARHGYPADAIAASYTPLGLAAQSNPRPGAVPFVPYQACCGANLWQPLWQAVLAGGFDGVVRGQKFADHLRAPVGSGFVHEGVEFFHPIEAWADSDVLAFLGDRVPPSYARGLKSSLDCVHCTAYVDKARIDDLRQLAPERAEHIVRLHRELARQLHEALAVLEE
jgi:3'-phosphoadenosine 5'-phosphosulfate sulfotransferase (PAPS reductase)/FAD synthetase